MSVMMRKANRFNVENRAHRLLDKEKRDIAPKFESNLRDMERVLKGKSITENFAWRFHTSHEYVTHYSTLQRNLITLRNNRARALDLTID